MLRLSFLIILALSISSCRFSEVEVDSDYSYSGKFNRYKTFAFVQNQTFEGTELDEKLVEHNIGRVLESWGYRYKERKPDFLILYNFFYDDVKMRGYNQPLFHSWVQSRFGKDLLTVENDSIISEDEVRRRDEKYTSADMNLLEGTIYVTFLDRRNDKSVWQGYASGVFGGDPANNERKLRASIIRILDEFRLITPSS